ncbi:hypothetical protein DL96DRAFT_416585 [Flagelloscypha sp. PMI_526]|nr:hypothetical protein DL96DRAFT_416585 [Flagelloscypha sp. PMI_526]
MPHRKKICVLVLDGENSTKAGVYPSFIQLREIMGRTAYDEGLEESETLPCKYFDLIVGSGDGGWAALLLGRLGMSASRAMAVYRQIHTAVHHTEPDLSAESKALKLEKLLQDLICSETKCKDLNSERLETTSDAQSCCRTAVLTKTAAHMASPILFRTYRVRDNPAVNCPIWQAIRACTAAPDVLPEVNIDGQQFTSAAHLGHSNPIELALSEVKTEFPDSEVDCIVSLGSGHPGHHSYQSSELSAYEKAAVHIAQDSELRAQAVTKQLNETGQAHIYFRLNVEQGLQSYMQAECPGYDDARTHTEQYLRRTEVGEAINKIVARLRGQCSTGASNMAPVIPLENIVHQETVHFQLSNAHPVQTYMDVLYELNMGLPLWDPQPFSKVVEIGDVGVLSEEGGFETFFNATVPADRQRYRVPPKFTPLELNPSNISSVPDAVRRPYLHNGDMTLTQIVGLENNGGGSGSHDQAFTLSFEVSNGAVLILKDPPTRLSIPPSPRVRAYLEKHYKAWYDWCRSAKGLDRDLEGRELIFVTGVYRSLDWAMGAWERIGIQRTVSYSGVATISGTVCKLTGLWTPALSRGIQNGPSQERPDPEYPALHPWRTEDIGAQCLFIRGYKIGVKQDLRHFPAKPILSVPDPTSDSKKIAWLNRLKNIRKAFKAKQWQQRISFSLQALHSRRSKLDCPRPIHLINLWAQCLRRYRLLKLPLFMTMTCNTLGSYLKKGLLSTISLSFAL